jgi:signal transduction histidine kinase
MTNPSIVDSLYPTARAWLDALGQAAVLFDTSGHYVASNTPARTILGANSALVQISGWQALALLIDTRPDPGPTADVLRMQAIESSGPVRLTLLLGGAYIPGWIAPLYLDHETCLLVTLERVDWTPVQELLGAFHREAELLVESMSGHTFLLQQLTANPPRAFSFETLQKRVLDMAGITAVDLYRMNRLLKLMDRLEVIRLGTLAERVRAESQKIKLTDFIENWAEDLNETPFFEPPRTEDIRDRLVIDVAEKLTVRAVPKLLTDSLRDLLQNAAIYSTPTSQILLRAYRLEKVNFVQIDMVDQGYGIRVSETDRVLLPFQRARQPQVIAAFGYGLSLYCVHAEVEAMGGHLWFESEEGMGATFSLRLPVV